MEQMLGCAPGSSSLMGLINDPEKKVQLLVDEDVLKDPYLGCHPCINTSSLKMRTEDAFHVFLPSTGHEMIIVRLEGGY